QRSVALVQVVVRVVLVVTAAAPGRRDLVGVVDAVLAHGLLLVCGQFRAVWRAYQRCWPARRVARPSALLLDVLGAPALAHRDAAAVGAAAQRAAQLVAAERDGGDRLALELGAARGDGLLVRQHLAPPSGEQEQQQEDREADREGQLRRVDGDGHGSSLRFRLWVRGLSAAARGERRPAGVTPRRRARTPRSRGRPAAGGRTPGGRTARTPRARRRRRAGARTRSPTAGPRRRRCRTGRRGARGRGSSGRGPTRSPRR